MGSEMCIRDSPDAVRTRRPPGPLCRPDIGKNPNGPTRLPQFRRLAHVRTSMSTVRGLAPGTDPSGRFERTISIDMYTAADLSTANPRGPMSYRKDASPAAKDGPMARNKSVEMTYANKLLKKVKPRGEEGWHCFKLINDCFAR